MPGKILHGTERNSAGSLGARNKESAERQKAFLVIPQDGGRHRFWSSRVGAELMKCL